MNLAKRWARRGLSLRKLGERLADAGDLNANDKPYAAQSIKNMLG